MSIDNFYKRILWTLALGLIASTPVVTQAQDGDADDPWKFRAAIYLWGAAIGGTTQGGNDIDVSFNDLFDNLNMAFMGNFEARKSKWSALADVVYMDVEADRAGTIGSTSIPDNANVQLSGWVFNLQGARTVLDTEQARLDILAGARYLDLNSTLTLTLGAAGPTGSASASETVWDGVVGVKGDVNITRKWYLPYYLDMGTGQSDFTWQGLGGVGYRFERVDVVLAYRYMYWDFDSGSPIKNIDFSGPALGAVFKF